MGMSAEDDEVVEDDKVEVDDVEDDDAKGEEDDDVENGDVEEEEEDDDVEGDDVEEEEDDGCCGWWCWGGGPMARPGPTLCASLRNRNALGHFPRATLCGNLP